jgi:hypothetical protein
MGQLLPRDRCWKHLLGATFVKSKTMFCQDRLWIHILTYEKLKKGGASAGRQVTHPELAWEFLHAMLVNAGPDGHGTYASSCVGWISFAVLQPVGVPAFKPTCLT